MKQSGARAGTSKRSRAGVLIVIGVVAGMVAVGGVTGAFAAAPRSAPTIPSDTTASYMVFDRTTGRTVSRSGEHRQYRSASLVKLLIALDYLYGKGSTSAVPAADRKLLESMLRSSNDDAASTLWVRGGYEQVVKRMVTRIGLADTAPPTDRRYWGYTAISAADIVTTYNFLLDRAPASYRDLIVGNLEQYTRCAADGFDQSFGIPRAVAGRKAVKQGWSGYGARPSGPACTEGQDTAPPTRESVYASEEAPLAMAERRPALLAAPSLDLSSRAMHTSGLVDGRKRVIVVLTLSPKTKSYDASSTTITNITRTLNDNAAAGSR